jgi:transposase-like protein
MGMRQDPAVRLCVTCGQLKAAGQFQPGRRICVACQQPRPGRAELPQPQHDPPAVVWARAREQARRRPIEQALLAGPTADLASAGDSLATAAAAALADQDGVPGGMPGPARSNRPASPTERQDAIAQAWRDEPGITGTALAERFGVSPRTIRRDTQALQEQGIQRGPANRRRRSHRTQAQYAAIYQRFLAWLADELGRPSTPQDLSGDVLARWIAQRASVGGHGGGGLSSASLRLECTALRHLVRHAGRPELAATCMPPGSRHPRQRPSHPPSTSGCSWSPTRRLRSASATGPFCGCWATSACVPARCVL